MGESNVLSFSHIGSVKKSERFGLAVWVVRTGSPNYSDWKFGRLKLATRTAQSGKQDGFDLYIARTFMHAKRNQSSSH